jgi:hypothetical protein
MPVSGTVFVINKKTRVFLTLSETFHRGQYSAAFWHRQCSMLKATGRGKRFARMIQLEQEAYNATVYV